MCDPEQDDPRPPIPPVVFLPPPWDPPSIDELEPDGDDRDELPIDIFTTDIGQAPMQQRGQEPR